MSTLSEQLKEAIKGRVALYPGLMVKVRTKKGDLVASGRIVRVDPEIGFVNVANNVSGADLRIDIDTKRYVIWVIPPENYIQSMPDQSTLYVRSSRPGAHAFSNVKM